MQHSVTKEPSIENAPTPEEIRKRAFEIHSERGGIHGCDLDNWLQAERELQEKYNGGGTVPLTNRKARKQPRRMSMRRPL